MKKGLLLIPLAGAVATFIALGAMSSYQWKWSDTGSKRKINYCLLIGQTDHNDSAARTGGIREALNTRRASTDPGYNEHNPNAETPIQGHLDLEVKSGKTETFEVNEMSSRVCVNYSGATWDQETAVTQCNTWYTKYKKEITMIISNNDGMAEGATFANNRPDGMPIFGYDSNGSTLNLINKGLIAGTINSNAPAQALIMNVLASRMLDMMNGKLSEKEYKAKLFAGMSGVEYSYTEGTKTIKESAKAASDDAYLEDGKFIQDYLGEGALKISYNEEQKAILVGSNIVNRKNIKDYLKLDSAANQLGVQPMKKAKKGYDFYQCCYSMTDTYLQSTMVPLLKVARTQFGLDDPNCGSIFYGNGNDEDKIINDINVKDKKQAYLINMIKTENGNKYIEAIKSKTGTDFEHTPIIFYNRQPTNKTTGAVDTELMKANPYTFYVGFDAKAGAEEQGKMIVDWVKDQAKAND